MTSGKEREFIIQKLLGLGFHSNDKQKMLYDSIKLNCLKVVYPKVVTILFLNIVRYLTLINSYFRDN